MINLDKDRKAVIAMVHAGALPGTPLSQLGMNEIIELAVKETEIYLSNGIDAVILENMHDIPYLKRGVGPEITASMTSIACELRKITRKPLGIQMLAGANKEALAVAQAADFDFIRVEGFVFGHLADEGYIESCAGELLRYRKQIGATNISIFTDIKKKHSSHAITHDISLFETVKAAEFFLSDGIIVTGSATGKAASLEDVTEARKATHLPLIVGSGITKDNINVFWKHADAFIVGSYFKYSGQWQNDVDKTRVIDFMDHVLLLRDSL